jgi:hypothetical protein
MSSQYDALLQEVMGLILSKTPKARIIARAKDVKSEITAAWSDAQQAINFLDLMIERYAPDPEYPKGFWFTPPQSNQVFNPVNRNTISTLTNPIVQRIPPRITLISDPKHITDLAIKLSSDGIIETKTIIAQLRTEGDIRLDRDMAKSIGNILARYGWQRVEPGRYKQQELTEKGGEKV